MEDVLAYDRDEFGASMTSPLPHHWRAFFAILCLCSVVLLYAPFGGAVWSLYSARCCTTSQCPIKGHHLQMPATPEYTMDCGHDMPSLSTCSLSCCHNPDRPSLTPLIFVLPAPVKTSAFMTFEPLLSLPVSQDSVRAIEPLSPPPRISAAAA